MLILEDSLLFSTIDVPIDGDCGRASRLAVVSRHDSNKYFATRHNVLTPLAFHFTISAAIEVAVLGKVIEFFARTIEARRNIVTSIVS